MSKTSTRLLAVCATAAAVLATTVPATAATPPEATAAAYVFVNGTTSEALVAENADLTATHLASGYTEAHRGWDIRLSDEAYNAGLPRQDFRAEAAHRETNASAIAGGFVSLIDREVRDVPFAVVKLGNRYYSCSVGRPFSTRDTDKPRLWLRQADGELHEIKGVLESWTSAMHVDSTNSPRIPTTVRVNRFTTTAELAAYPQFAKYADRTEAGGGGFELAITQHDTTYRILVGAAAASC